MSNDEWPTVYRWPDARYSLPAELRRAGQKLDLVAESPPYWAKRRYSDSPAHDEWGAGSLDRYITDVVDHGREVWKVTKNWGWWALCIGDTRSNTGGAGGDANAAGQRIYRPGACHLEGSQAIQVPARVAIAIQDRTRWRLQGVVVWDKGRPVRTDNSLHHLTRNRRPGNAHEMVYLFTKPGAEGRSPYWDPTYLESMKERGDVWSVAASTVRPPWADESDDTPPWPDELVRRLVLTLCPPGGRVADFCAGYGTTARVAAACGRVGLAFDPFTATADWPPAAVPVPAPQDGDAPAEGEAA